MHECLWMVLHFLQKTLHFSHNRLDVYPGQKVCLVIRHSRWLTVTFSWFQSFLQCGQESSSQHSLITADSLRIRTVESSSVCTAHVQFITVNLKSPLSLCVCVCVCVYLFFKKDVNTEKCLIFFFFSSIFYSNSSFCECLTNSDVQSGETR